MQDFQIGVVGGLGHIGLIQAACLAKLGYRTVAYDNNRQKIEEILQGKMPFHERGLDGLVKETVKNRLLRFSSQISDLQEAEVLFLCVGTPPLPSGEADTSQVYAAVMEAAENRKEHCFAVVKSTVPVGTSRRLSASLQEHGFSERVTMVSNPEFLREGSGLEDFWQPARIVVGAETEETAEKIAAIYKPEGVPVILTSWENAELIKYAGNAFLANKISFINEMAVLCECVGADVRVISKGIGLDPRIGAQFLEAGIGFSGPCLEKDLKALIRQFQAAGKEANLLEAALLINEEQRSGIVQKLQDQLGTLQGRQVCVLGMAFKAGTDDVRDSHSIPIVKHLLSLGARVTVHDPMVKSPEESGVTEAGLAEIIWAASPYEAAQGQEALLILTAWPEYKKLDLQRLRSCLKYPLIIDGRNLFNRREMQKMDIYYLGVGI